MCVIRSTYAKRFATNVALEWLLAGVQHSVVLKGSPLCKRAITNIANVSLFEVCGHLWVVRAHSEVGVRQIGILRSN